MLFIRLLAISHYNPTYHPLNTKMIRMCGRYNIITDAEAIMKAFEILNDINSDESVTHYNIAPTQRVPVITKAGESRQLSRMRWGLIPNWTESEAPKFTPFNAKSETIREKLFFKYLLKSKRCLIPASGFYEWQKTPNGKLPYHIRLSDHKPFAFAGLWDTWTSPNGELNSCTILTTSANKLIQPIHQRMPVILSTDDYQQWLDCDTFNKEEIVSLLKPYDADAMEAYVISSRVNKATNNSVDLIEPIAKP